MVTVGQTPNERLMLSSKRSQLPAHTRARSKRTINDRRRLRRAIQRAETLLPGQRAEQHSIDPRWQAIIRVGEFIGSHPDEVLEFALRWGKHAQKDLRAAIATCLLEHLLEHHFERVFPRVRTAALTSRRFADTFSGCWKFGQTNKSANSRQFDTLLTEIAVDGALMPSRKRA